MKQENIYFISINKRKLNILINRDKSESIKKLERYLYKTFNDVFIMRRYRYNETNIYYCDIIKNGNIEEIKRFLNELNLKKSNRWNNEEIHKKANLKN